MADAPSLSILILFPPLSSLRWLIDVYKLAAKLNIELLKVETDELAVILAFTSTKLTGAPFVSVALTLT